MFDGWFIKVVIWYERLKATDDWKKIIWL